jgi:hypothetical protein
VLSFCCSTLIYFFIYYISLTSTYKNISEVFNFSVQASTYLG